jgi:hypothetical protein
LKILFLLPTFAAVSLLSSSVIAQTIVTYKSPIEDYKAFVDEKVTSWKAANDKVGQIGGWRAYAKEARQPDNTPTPSPNSAPMQKPAGSSGDVLKTDPHTGHKQ